MRRSYPSRISKRSADAALVQLLHGCKPEMLSTFTAAGLAASYRVSADKAAQMLEQAKRGRL